VASYLMVRRLARCVTKDFAELESVTAFWNDSPEFVRMRRENPGINADRFTLTNVIGRIHECPKPPMWTKWYEQIARGKQTLPGFIRRIIVTRKK
jgi:hypothetical protein